ncbi:BTAD domain-containing putative transcriptional regulator [Loktanella sp. IMCC34160]|uniref:AfsR/SARP family transcriptional regulator n=1 Tax=Loktanella sp. IMCC34160 TaxID=2510646 RepID=UPI0013EB0F39|nr:BTAD domain-containing putative transcriptional regulator [Loktanella sp. IMCC34160]
MSTALWRLRKCNAVAGSIHRLGRDRLVFAPTQRTWVDALAFQHIVNRAGRGGAQAGHLLIRAIAIYEGAAFSDLSDDWALTERARLENTYCDALAMLAQISFESGDFRAAESLATRLTKLEPFREDIREIQMKAAMMQGNVAQAERFYREFKAILMDDLMEPPRCNIEDLTKEVRASEYGATVFDRRSLEAGYSDDVARSIRRVRRSLKQFDRRLETLSNTIVGRPKCAGAPAKQGH